jgi:hypothetical protein
MPHRRTVGAVTIAAALSLAFPGRGSGQGAASPPQPPSGKAETPRPPSGQATSPPQRGGGAPASAADETELAKAELREMSTALTSAQTLRFDIRNLVPMKSPAGDWVTLVGAAKVMRRGNDKLHVETGGDLFPFTMFFDGKTVTAYSPDAKVYARRDAPPTIDAMLEQAAKKGEAVFVFADLVSADPYAAMTKGLQSARVVGLSKVDGVETRHVAVHGERMDWEIWIGTKDRLPRMVTLTDVAETRKPTHTVELTEWALDQDVPDDAFSFRAPADATQVPFRNPGEARAAARRPPATNRAAPEGGTR